MSVQSAVTPEISEKSKTSRPDVLIAALLAILALVPAIANGSIIDWSVNNDSMMRLVQIRDLLAGQAWFDYTQYRMGPEGGFVMHWSRIVDLPVAAIIVAVTALTGSVSGGELVAGVLWPSVLMALSIFAIIRSARLLGCEHAVFPAAIIGLISLYTIGIYVPGAFDHHNLQLTLCLLALPAVLGGRRAHHGFVAGAAMAVMMAIGLETLPVVAIVCLTIAMSFLLHGHEVGSRTMGFGAGFSAISALLFVATVGPGDWFAAHCDAFSAVHLSIAMAGGLGLALAATPSLSSSSVTRIAVLGGLGAGLALLVVAAYPQCLADPYAGLDERLKTYWLSAIGEAQPVNNILRNDPVMFAKYYITPIAALAVLATSLPATANRRPLTVMTVILLTAVLVSFWQVRGANFAIALAAVPLAMWVAEKRQIAAADGSAKPALVMVLAWLVSLNVCWMLAAQVLGDMAAPAVAANQNEEKAVGSNEGCYMPAAHWQLSAMPAGTVAAVSNLGPAILKYTSHRVLAGPYHRNIAGNIANLDILMGTPEQSRQAIAVNNVDIVAHCSSDDETRFLVRTAPHSLIAKLVLNEPPEWLTPIGRAEKSGFVIYRVKQ